MDLLHLVDRLEELVAAAQKMPIGNRAIVDRRRMLDIVDQMRISIPQDVRDAQAMVASREELLREAEEEARMVVARAEQQAARMIEDHEIAAGARQRAQEIAVHAESRLEERIAEANQDIQERMADSRRIADQEMTAADAYARELLNRLADQLRAFVRSVETGMEQLEPAAPAASVPPPYAEDPPARSGLEAASPSEAEEPVDRAGPTSGDRPEDQPRDLGHDTGFQPGDAVDRAQRIAAPLSLRRAVAEQELEGLPGRPARSVPSRPTPPAEPGVIDDFDLPSLDDDPTLPRSGGDA